jgi:hypothetical protein
MKVWCDSVDCIFCSKELCTRSAITLRDGECKGYESVQHMMRVTVSNARKGGDGTWKGHSARVFK